MRDSAEYRQRRRFWERSQLGAAVWFSYGRGIVVIAPDKTMIPADSTTVRPASTSTQPAPAPSQPQGPVAPPSTPADPLELGGLDTTRTVHVTVNGPLSTRGMLDRAYEAMAEQAGLGPLAKADFVCRAAALDDGQVHAPSATAARTGAALSEQQLQHAIGTGSLEVAPTLSQVGLLSVLKAQDSQPPLFPQFPSGFGAGLPWLQPKTSTLPVTPANTAVTPEVAAQILDNVSHGLPPFKPELGRVGAVSWFVSEGNPFTGTGPEKNVILPVEVTNTSGKPVVTFGEKELLEIYATKISDATQTAEAQVRQRYGRTHGEDLNSTQRSQVRFQAHAMAQRAVWDQVGETVRNSESGVGKVTLQDSTFSRDGNGEFMLTSKAENVRIKGGTQGLLDIIRTQGVPAEPGVLEAAQKLATSQDWGGRVQGAFRVGGKVLIVVGAANDVYRIYTAHDKVKTAVEVAGGWAGATAAGGAFASAFAPADAAGPWAWAAHGVGTLAAGAVGYWAGSNITKSVYELTVEGKPIELGP